MGRELLNPRGLYHFEENAIAPRLPDLNRKVLGFIDNSKDNVDLFLKGVRAALEAKYDILDVLTIRKNGGSVPAPFTEAFFDRCDFVINAFGD